MQRFSISSTRNLVSQLVVAAGAPAPKADVLADALLDADIHGASTHGVSRLNIYLKRTKLGLIDPRAELQIEARRAAVLRVDANVGERIGVVRPFLQWNRRGKPASVLNQSQCTV